MRQRSLLIIGVAAVAVAVIVALAATAIDLAGSSIGRPGRYLLGV
ncbi:MAG TPA: hypothetical protein VLW53_00650 [Candidatus Eisenbacteria bacterium]|nr:hypothetical protein [Candidatus Eisenbacteria bacterium]